MNELVEINEMEADANVYMDESSEIKPDSFENTVILPMDMSIEMIADWDIRNKLVLDPEFQRRNVWDNKRKSKFIESLILGVPIPSLLLANDSKKNKFIVIDGKQRLNTIIEFIASKNNGKGFKLTGLTILEQLNKKDYSMISTKPELETYFTRLQNALLKLSVIKNYDISILYFIFSRLNTGSVALSTQELRQALYPGEFTKYINNISLKDNPVWAALNIKKPHKRMKDAEMYVRYFSFKYYLNEYNGNINEFFNNTCEKLNLCWDKKEEKIHRDIKELDKSIQFIKTHLEDNSFKIYSIEKKSFVKLFNRPMFDLYATVFSIPENRMIFENSDENLEEFTICIFQNNKKFADAFLPTTHSKQKTNVRFEEFNAELNKIR